MAAGLVVVVGLSLPVAGCSVAVKLAGRPAPDVRTATPTPTAVPLNPVEKLVDAAAKTNTGVITVVMRAPGVTTEARLDPDGRKATMRIVVGDDDVDLFTAELIQIDSDLYLRVPDLPGASRKWMRRDVGDLPAGSPPHLLRKDHTGAGDLANCIVSAKRYGGHEFTGVMDLTRSRVVSRTVVAALGAKATAVPFSARTSTDGSLFGITLHLPTPGDIEYAYSRADVVEVERPPASEVTELPQPVLDRLFV